MCVAWFNLAMKVMFLDLHVLSSSVQHLLLLLCVLPLSLFHSMHYVQRDLPTVYVLLLYLCYSLHAWLHIMNSACNCT